MKKVPISQARARLGTLVDHVVDSGDAIILTRHGQPAAVLVSVQEMEAWKETSSIRADDELLAEIRSGLRALERRDAKLYQLDELLD